MRRPPTGRVLLTPHRPRPAWQLRRELFGTERRRQERYSLPAISSAPQPFFQCRESWPVRQKRLLPILKKKGTDRSAKYFPLRYSRHRISIKTQNNSAAAAPAGNRSVFRHTQFCFRQEGTPPAGADPGLSRGYRQAREWPPDFHRSG